MNGYRSRWVRAGAGVATLLLGGGGIFLGTATAANAAGPTCGGLDQAAAQLAGYKTFDNSLAPPGPGGVGVTRVYTPYNDWIVGSSYNDTLDGQGGNDL